MFKNEALTDFTIESNRQKFRDALATLDTQIKNGIHVKPIIAGKGISCAAKITSTDPSDPSIVVGTVEHAGAEQADEAMRVLNAAALEWRNVSFQKRAEILRKAAKIMRDQKFEISALMVREAGKPWAEADGDTAEGIDFCEYYANEMMRLGPPQRMGNIPGEENIYFYQPRGVGVVISPWNFPFAITCGMTVAALVTGNTVAIKPSDQTALIAHKLVEILLQAGFPPDTIAYLPGRGSVVGAKMVRSPSVDFICFTGSQEVGLDIIKAAAEVHPGQRNVKRVIAEMGGKNAAIIDEDADLDEAIKGVLHSAFGYAGQKCSACSRAIVVGDIYETFVERLSNAAADLLVGPAKEPSTFLPPVIDIASQKRLLKQIEDASKDLKVAFKGNVPNVGNFVPATIFRDVPVSHWIWSEELFGPVVAVSKAKNFDEALAMANNSPYALTGGVFSRSPVNLDKARRDFKVGNLYINRKQTGALVYRQPFGGFKMSGVGSKAGGPDYLIQFMEPRTITENTMRKGFAPKVD
jgi:RHH-type proline utilization regulon transcriptional repressor/proline dehydrogenase/delta 1-pyrroline-5-carboxylate dehydrogenase